MISADCSQPPGTFTHQRCNTYLRFNGGPMCYCRCHFPDTNADWDCRHGSRDIVDTRPHPARPQTHPFSYTRVKLRLRGV